ncbi:hypothetical protein MN608_04571 [Microdochium nivale]|nr:hypothetical protein MN608_04571 [Microdochium nivale]
MFDGYSDIVQREPWLASPSSSSGSLSYGELLEGYESMSRPRPPQPRPGSHQFGGDSSSSHESYEGVEGVYRFLEECDRARNPY